MTRLNKKRLTLRTTLELLLRYHLRVKHRIHALILFSFSLSYFRVSSVHICR